MAYYSKTIQEEELKNKVREEWFSGYDNTAIQGKVDFYVGHGNNTFLWAEAKRGVKRDIYEQFVQLILTIGKDRRFNEQEAPDYLGSFDAEKIGFVHYDEISEVFEMNDFNWQVTPSNHATREFKHLYELVHDRLKNHVFIFNFEQHGDSLRFFIKDRFSLSGRRAARVNVNKNNFPHIYRRWLKEVKPTLAINWEDLESQGIYDCDFFLADLMSQENTTLLENLSVLLKLDHYIVATGKKQGSLSLFSHIDFNDKQMAHRLFWQRYKRPPREEYRDYIIERSDRLRPQNVRMYHGAYFTPLQWVEKAQEYLSLELGEDWQDNYYVWDCAAGTGNLLAGLVNKNNLWASTLEQADVATMNQRIEDGFNLYKNHVFQFDFLNDFLLDYTNKEGEFMQSKVPQPLQAILRDEEERKKLVIFINPPFKEAATKTTVKGTGENAAGVAINSKVYKTHAGKWGISCRELFTQFMINIHEQMNGCKIGQFSTLKIPVAPNFSEFRKFFHARAGRCFIVPGNTFDNVRGQFPIGFFTWHTDDKQPVGEILADVFNKDGEPMGTKKLTVEKDVRSINDWIITTRNRTNERNIGFMSAKGCDFQNQNYNFIINSKAQLPHPRGTQVTDMNLKEIAVYLAARHTVKRNWLNDRDQFTEPFDSWGSDTEFQNDCLVYTIFSNSNNIQSEAGVNHWQPFTEDEIGIRNELPSHFMTDYISGEKRPRIIYGNFFENQEENKKPLVFSEEAKAVFDAGRELWKYYHQQPDADLNASYYDIRKYFQGTRLDKKGKEIMNSTSEDKVYTRLHSVLRQAHRKLSEKIAAKVYEHGFLR
ncbi:MAG: hypothetical protein K2H16_03870 [Prevotella sp.]|nr:hypothetical protein [Prevotella sp.]